MPEYLKEIIANPELFVNGLVFVSIILGVVLEASPIPINPLKWLGNKLNQDLKKDINTINDKINTLDKRLDKIDEDNLKKDLEQKRKIVLDFADKIRTTDPDKLGIQQCTHENFKFVEDVMDEYHVLIEKHNIDNGKFDVARSFILDTYAWLSKEGRFAHKDHSHE